MRSIQFNPMIFMSDRLSVAFSFSRRAHLFTTGFASGGIPPVGRARALFPKRPPDASPEGADNATNRHCLCRRRYSYPLLFCFVQQNDCSRFGTSPAACLRKPATGNFIAVMGIARPIPIFFCKKKQKAKMKGR